MNRSFDFETWQPPILTEEMLRIEYKKRQKRKILLGLFIAFLTSTLAMVVLFAIACRYSRIAALAVLTLLCISLVCMGVTAVVLIVKRRDLFYELY